MKSESSCKYAALSKNAVLTSDVLAGTQSCAVFLRKLPRHMHTCLKSEILRNSRPLEVRYEKKLLYINWKVGARGAQFVEALRYKPEGRGFDSRWCHWNFSLP
jgi:hypothetical protein